MPGILNISRGRRLVVALSVLALALPVTALSAGAAQPRVVVAGVTPLPSGVQVVNTVITTSFDLALTEPHQAALTSFLASLSDTASANYHHFLTPTTYAKRFGASATTVSAVRNYLARYGITTLSLSKGHNLFACARFHDQHRARL